MSAPTDETREVSTRNGTRWKAPLGARRSRQDETGTKKSATILPVKRPLAIVGSALFALVVGPRPASAQVRWDASAQVGGAKRFVFNRPHGGPDAGFGPAFQLNGHVALLPLLRVGAYLSGDVTSTGPATRQMVGGGARVVGIAPWRTMNVHAWLFAGFGYELVFAPSYHATLSLAPDDSTPPQPTDVLVTQAGGSMYEVPFGVGVAYALRPPFELVAELGARVGLGFTGSVYQDPGRAFFTPGYPENRLLPAGNDAFSTFLTVGLGFGR